MILCKLIYRLNKLSKLRSKSCQDQDLAWLAYKLNYIVGDWRSELNKCYTKNQINRLLARSAANVETLLKKHFIDFDERKFFLRQLKLYGLYNQYHIPVITTIVNYILTTKELLLCIRHRDLS